MRLPGGDWNAKSRGSSEFRKIKRGTALNTNPDRENANGAIFLNNMLKEVIGKDLLTFTPAP